MIPARTTTSAGWKHADEEMSTRGGVFHFAGRDHTHRWRPRSSMGIRTRTCRDCGTVQIQLRGHWTKLGS